MWQVFASQKPLPGCLITGTNGFPFFVCGFNYILSTSFHGSQIHAKAIQKAPVMYIFSL